MATLSVLMPNFNHGQYIAQAIDAIAGQVRRPDEFIILDDASTDDSVSVIRTKIGQYPWIRLIAVSKNGGVLNAIATLVETATCDYIYTGAADDYILPGFIEKSMAMLERYPQAALCCSDMTQSIDGGPIVQTFPAWSATQAYFTPAALSRTIRGTYIPGHTAIFKRLLFNELGGFNRDLRWHCDWFAMLVLGFRYGVCYIPGPLAVFRVDGESYSTQRRAWSDQKPVITEIIRLFTSPEYRDIAPLWRRGNVLLVLAPGIIRAVFADYRLWRPTVMRICIGLLWPLAIDRVKQTKGKVLSRLFPRVPEPAVRLYRKLRGRG